MFAEYTKKRIQLFEAQGYCPPKITKLLESKGIVVSQRGLAKFLLQVKVTGLTARHAGSGRPTNLTAEVKSVIEMAMRNDDKTTVVHLHELLVSKEHNGHSAPY